MVEPADGPAQDLILIIIDDDPLTVEMIATVASIRGYSTIPLTDPSEVDRVLGEQDGRLVILSDVDLRTDESGLQAAHRWLSIQPAAQLILMSGHRPDMIPGFADRPKGAQFVQKPFSFTDLEELLPT